MGIGSIVAGGRWLYNLRHTEPPEMIRAPWCVAVPLFLPAAVIVYFVYMEPPAFSGHAARRSGAATDPNRGQNAFVLCGGDRRAS